MKELLGITRLRPGPSGNSSATNAVNYDITKANPFPNLPEVLTLKNGQKVTPAEQWWKQRRPEIVEDFEREVIGRVPKIVPTVTWMVVSQALDRVVGDLPVDAHELIALRAPRPTFISYGIPERGDAHWLDQQGSYMATVAAGPVFRLLGARAAGCSRITLLTDATNESAMRFYGRAGFVGSLMVPFRLSL